MHDILIMSAITGVAIFVLVVLQRRGIDNFLSTVNPEATGIERPLWGPLYKVPGYRDSGNYFQMRDTPQCVDPTMDPGCHRVPRRYPLLENNKI